MKPLFKYLSFLLVIVFPLCAGAQPYQSIWDGTHKLDITAGQAAKVDGSAVTQPVSGTLTCNAGTNLNTSALATSANQTTIIGHVDGLETLLSTSNTNTGNTASNTATIAGAVAGTEMQVDVLTMPTTTVTATNLDIRDLTSGSDSITVTGTVAATQSGTWDEVGINDSGNSITVDGTVAATQSGTWTVQPGNTANTTPWLASLHDGTTKGSIFDLTNSNPLSVGIVDANGDQITSFGGGTQYTEGDTDASITGTAMLMEGAGNTLLSVPGSTADGITVNLGSNNDVVASATNLDIRDLSSGSDSVEAFISDGTDTADVLDLTNNNPLTVAITDANGDQITSFGGGTQYTESDTDASITGTAMLMEGAGNTLLSVPGTTADGLLVNLGTNNDVTVTGTVAATQSGTWDEVGINDSGNSITVDYATTGSGTATGALRVELPTNGTGVIATVGAVTSLTNALPAGTNAIGKLAANSGVDIGDVTIDNATLAVTQSGTWTVQPGNTANSTPWLASVHDGTNKASVRDTGSSDSLNVAMTDSTGAQVSLASAYTEADTDATIAGVAIMWEDTSDTLRSVSAAKPLPVSDAGSSLTVDGTVTASNTAGDIAHGSGDSGNPVKVGSEARSSLPTAVSNGQRADAVSDLFGRVMVTHIDPAQQIHKNVNFTTTQTGTDVWSPTSGKKIAVTSVIISSYDTTGCRLLLWFGDNADTTYTAGTDQLLIPFSTVPSTTVKPGMVYTPPVPVFCTTADRELHVTTDAACDIDIVVEGYEF